MLWCLRRHHSFAYESEGISLGNSTRLIGRIGDIDQSPAATTCAGRTHLQPSACSWPVSVPSPSQALLITQCLIFILWVFYTERLLCCSEQQSSRSGLRTWFAWHGCPLESLSFLLEFWIHRSDFQLFSVPKFFGLLTQVTIKNAMSICSLFRLIHFSMWYFQFPPRIVLQPAGDVLSVE